MGNQAEEAGDDLFGEAKKKNPSESGAHVSRSGMPRAGSYVKSAGTVASGSKWVEVPDSRH